MKVKRKKIVGLFMAMGFATADKWSSERLTGKLEKLGAMVDQDTELADEHKQLLDKILKAQKSKEAVEIIASEGQEEPEAKATATAVAEPPKKGKQAKPAPEPEEDDEDEDEDDTPPKAAPKQPTKTPAKAPKNHAPTDDEVEPEEEEETEPEDEEQDDEMTKDEEAELEEEEERENENLKKQATNAKKPSKAQQNGKKRGAPQKAGGPDGPGIIGSIVEFVKKATPEKPITKKEIVAKLAKRFPEKDPEGMEKTVNVQVPNRIKKEKGINIVRHPEGGYYVSDEEESSE